MDLYVVKYTTIFGSISTMILDDIDTAFRTMNALEAAGCEDVGIDTRKVTSEIEAKNAVLDMTRAEGVKRSDVLKAWVKTPEY